MANQYDTNLKLQAIADAIGDTQSSGLIQALEDIADAVAGGGGGGSSTAGLVSDNFSETDTYDLGDYCIHNNTLYVCINAINTPGPWDLSDWQATNAGIQLSSLNSAIADMLTLDYANQVELKDTLNQTGRTYTIPKTGLIRCIATNTANGDGYYVLRTNRSVSDSYQRDIVYIRDDVITQGVFNEVLVNKGETVVVDAMLNKIVNTCLFIPFKGSI